MSAILLAAGLLVAGAVAQEECNGVKPVFVDFHDRNVNNSEHRIQYGLFIGVGTPFQNQSLWPSIRRNETTFSGPDFCDGSNLASCSDQTHGTYKPEDSDSFRQETFQPLDSTTVSPASVEVMGFDTLNIYTHYFDPSPPNVTHIADFPVSQLTNYTSSDSPWFGPSGLLGLGPSAPILQQLVDQGDISTRSFGLYIGTAYSRAGGAINGSLTLGGYDSGRLEGQAHNFTLATDYDSNNGETPFRVTVDSLVLNDLNNNNESISLASDPFTAYLTTDQYSMTFPQPITDAFLQRTSAESDPRPNTFSEPTFYLPDNANFSLTLTLSTGLSITIPPEELRNVSNASPISSVPSVSSPASGAPSSANNATGNDTTTTLSTRQSNPSPSSGTAILGTLLLSHLYLTTNYDASPSPSFYLHLAKPHGPYIMTKPICGGDKTNIPVEAAAVHISSWTRNGTIGAVLGGVIGGIALAVLGWWLWVGWRRRSVGDAGSDKGEGQGEWDAERTGRKSLLGGGAASGKRARVVALVSGHRGRFGKGKEKAGGYQAADQNARKGSSGRSSNSSNGSANGDREGEAYAMQQFAPVAVPLAYSHESGRYYDQQQQASSATDVGGSEEHLPQQRHLSLDSPYQNRGRPALLAPITTTATMAESADAPIGQAISTPPLYHDHDHDHDSEPEQRTHTPILQPLRSLSPISPVSPLLPSTPTSTSEPFAFPFTTTATPTKPDTRSQNTIIRKPISTAAAAGAATGTGTGTGTDGLGEGGGVVESYVTVPLSPAASGSTITSMSPSAYSEAAWTGEARVGKRLRVGGAVPAVTSY